jgi:hypothetical protein
MGVHNTRNPRVTVYLKRAHVDFLDGVIKGLSKKDIPIPSRSELIRVILDKLCKSEDYSTDGLYKEILKKSKGINNQKS